MIDLSSLDFVQQMQFKEAGLRGLYVSISCDIEFMLVDIIAKCEIDIPSQREPYKLKHFGNTVSFPIFRTVQI